MSRPKHTALSGGLIHHVSCQADQRRPKPFNAEPGGPPCRKPLCSETVCGVGSLMDAVGFALASVCHYLSLTCTCHPKTQLGVTSTAAVARNEPEKEFIVASFVSASETSDGFGKGKL